MTGSSYDYKWRSKTILQIKKIIFIDLNFIVRNLLSNSHSQSYFNNLGQMFSLLLS